MGADQRARKLPVGERDRGISDGCDESEIWRITVERLTTDAPQGNFETMLNYVYSKDGIAYIRSDGKNDDVPLHEWARRECVARGCDEFQGESFEEIDEAICDCAFDYGDCPIFLAYTFACQACHLRDRLKKYEDTGLTPEELDKLCRQMSNIRMAIGAKTLEELHQIVQDGRLVVMPCKVGDLLYEADLPEYGVITCKVLHVGYYIGPAGHVPGNPMVSVVSVGVKVIDGHGEGSSYDFEADDFGKTVFFTREEADAALKGGAE